jgi:hypothetical protein
MAGSGADRLRSHHVVRMGGQGRVRSPLALQPLSGARIDTIRGGSCSDWLRAQTLSGLLKQRWRERSGGRVVEDQVFSPHASLMKR